MLRLIPSGPSNTLESLQGILSAKLFRAAPLPQTPNPFGTFSTATSTDSHPRRSSSHLFAFLTLIWHAFPQSHFSRNVSAPLFSCSGARGSSSKGIKNPEGLGGTSGRRYGTSYVPVRRCLGSSMLPLSRLVDGLTVVNASLAQRKTNYTASRRDKATGQASEVRPTATWAKERLVGRTSRLGNLRQIRFDGCLCALRAYSPHSASCETPHAARR
jgi:hypothetical protein